jgi:hypothetical protein
VVKVEIVHCGGAALTKLGRKAKRRPSIDRTASGVSTGMCAPSPKLLARGASGSLLK